MIFIASYISQSITLKDSRFTRYPSYKQESFSKKEKHKIGLFTSEENIFFDTK